MFYEGHKVPEDFCARWYSEKREKRGKQNLTYLFFQAEWLPNRKLVAWECGCVGVWVCGFVGSKERGTHGKKGVGKGEEKNNDYQWTNRFQMKWRWTVNKDNYSKTNNKRSTQSKQIYNSFLFNIFPWKTSKRADISSLWENEICNSSFLTMKFF